MKKSWPVIPAILACLAIPAAAAGAGSGAPPPEIRHIIHAVKPYGEGEARVLVVTAYTADLWTDAATWSMRAPFALTIRYGMGFDTPDLVDRTLSEMAHVDPALSDADKAKFKPQLEKVFPPVKADDEITALYTPGKPVAFFRNGLPTGRIGGPAFAKDFFGIWLSPGTSDAGLRRKLLRL